MNRTLLAASTLLLLAALLGAFRALDSQPSGSALAGSAGRPIDLVDARTS